MTKKPAKTKAPPYRGAAGYSELGVDRYIDDAERNDRGTTRHPWPARVKAKIKAKVEGMRNLDEVKAMVNAVVVAELGGGPLGKGPLA